MTLATLGTGGTTATAILPSPTSEHQSVGTGNPCIPGYFADPSHVEHQGRHYIYATLDPWGGETLGCWSSLDFKHWEYHTLNWPTKAACTTSKSHANMVWAPSVMRTPRGDFVMYVSVGSEIWVGKAAHPLGPWHDALNGKPLIPADYKPGYHMIDAEVFIDDDGKGYLYWGSGWNWTNGRCWVAQLNADFTVFIGEAIDVTPENYFEAPLMVKHDGRYYLMYSQGKTTDHTYRVHYAMGLSPLGPFFEAPNSPVLTTDEEINIIGPGHHTVIRRRNEHFILYHRHNLPFSSESTIRQLCIDELRFTSQGLIEKVVPTHGGPAFLRDRLTARANLLAPATGVVAAASSSKGDFCDASRVLDHSFATRWAPSAGDETPWLQLDLGQVSHISRQEIRFEYPWRNYAFLCETSLDGVTWKPLADYTKLPASGSPFVIKAATRARHLRLTFQRATLVEPSVIEWVVE